MAEETTQTTETTQEAVAERTVPYQRFKEVNDRLAAEKQARSDLEDRMSQLEDRDKTDVERLTRELEKAQKRTAEFEQRAAELESARERDSKMSLLSAAAAKAKFHDPTLAGQIVNLEDIEDAKSAEAAVKALVKDRPYLVQQEDATRQRLRQVGVDGGTIDESREKGLVTVEEQERAWGEQMLQGLQGQLRDQSV
jgi:Arc/MetJ family transcription regulator